MAIPTSGRVRKHRQTLKRAGLRPVQIWVPDSRRLGFAEECRRQSGLLRDDPQVLLEVERALAVFLGIAK